MPKRCLQRFQKDKSGLNRNARLFRKRSGLQLIRIHFEVTENLAGRVSEQDTIFMRKMTIYLDGIISCLHSGILSISQIFPARRSVRLFLCQNGACGKCRILHAVPKMFLSLGYFRSLEQMGRFTKGTGQSGIIVPDIRRRTNTHHRNVHRIS